MHAHLFALPLLTLLLVVLGWALGELIGERTLPTLMLAYAPPLLWVLLCLPALAWAAWRRLGWGMALAALLLAAWSAGLLHWRPQQAGTLRVVTFNVLGGARTTPAGLGSALRALNADVILLQEARFHTPTFETELQAALPGYRAVRAEEVLTLTRLPLLGTDTRPLPGLNRAALVTHLRWAGRPLTVMNAHPGATQVSAALRDPARLRRSRDLRAAQLDVLITLARRTPGPLILGGDLNTPPRGPAYRALRQAVGPDTFQRAGRGPGWTYPGLRLRIDHQFSRDLRPSRARVLLWRLSDHRPLLVEYRP
ncbi:endonuclease/exonuclease/phosphatase family protein [Deinococcus soli (ex Cha et al. 2016)]|uniref:Vancomycin resistance protein VanJ n=2 Tax=Deinococcus soli (ex Cha et al. 2016) TaxID=1309411 RepID=A0ACC6KLG6_9DEIO|nr:endonuclease/exonuclease/phosphatase family protein [Deinococcus soli (ex Cha et al. 2016)]MDR6220215.1 vancomycin resistance protein VanJ [Deinococcus soli (ex Cha et al. 2016)]MDR6330070.1 vancomycin resistance protein VanJ [Deinococcus soli (ex Cha et al. 2016)]MDR6753299.1 vancomycin resistance protein VanJ [Deinococcus soli (ex Cha et al. 2016)]